MMIKKINFLIAIALTTCVAVGGLMGGEQCAGCGKWFSLEELTRVPALVIRIQLVQGSGSAAPGQSAAPSTAESTATKKDKSTESKK